eukprot:TRINITY_DN31863_c0_g1_i1.p1 TRINITY_DN31863_c0_g1~~TRINITY_DN31863_c0_g1_i1.p1  ORF type:complete len:320 (+),score=151.14 TRINITY_DN31863_c0_g1_i1:59-961(+)
MMNLYLFVFLMGFVLAIVVMKKLGAAIASFGLKETGVQCDAPTEAAPAGTASTGDLLRAQQEVEMLQHLLQEERRKSTILNDDLITTENDLMELQRRATVQEAELREARAAAPAAPSAARDAELTRLQKALTVCENLLADADVRAQRDIDKAVQRALQQAEARRAELEQHAASPEELQQLRSTVDALSRELEEERQRGSHYNADLIVSLKRDATAAQERSATLERRVEQLEHEKAERVVGILSGNVSGASTPCSSNPTTPRLGFSTAGGRPEERGEIVLGAERKLAELKAKMLAQRARRM